MKRKLGLWTFILVISMIVTACGGKGAQEQTDATGTPDLQPVAQEVVVKQEKGDVKVKKNPKNVVVFDYSSLDSLDKLGVEVTGVPQSNVPSYLSKYEDSKYKPVGALMEPDFEKISALAPELIIISGRQAAKQDEFNKIATTINLALDTTRYMESYEENAKILGQIFDKESEVEAELAKVKTEIEQLKTKVTATEKTALIILANEGKISAYGAGSRFGIIHDVFGFKPVDENIEVATHGQSVSFEYVAEKNPDYLFVIDRGAVVSSGGGSASKELIENELVKKTKAYQNGNIVYLDPNYWYLSGGGLLSVEAMVKEVAAAVK